MWMGGVRDTRDKEEADKVDGSHQMGSTDKEDKECDKVRMYSTSESNFGNVYVKISWESG